VAGKLLTKAAVLGLAAAGMGAAWTLAAQDGERTVRDGVFSARQAARGDAVFQSICSNCHDITEFTSAGAYLEDVDGESLWDTFEYVWSEMPEDDPSSLDPEDYAAVLSYLLSVYGLPAGEADLPTDQKSLEAITIARPSLPGS
jgi:mono/diheme cytochrome c family protein